MQQTKTLSKRKLRELGYLEWPTLELRQWVAECKAAGGDKYLKCKEYLRLQHNQAQADHEYERRSNVATIPDTEQAEDQNIATWEYLNGLGLKPNTIEHTVAKLLIGGYLQVDIADKLEVSHQYITQIVNKLRAKLADRLPRQPAETAGWVDRTPPTLAPVPRLEVAGVRCSFPCPKCHCERFMWLRSMETAPVGFYRCRYCGYQSESLDFRKGEYKKFCEESEKKYKDMHKNSARVVNVS